jgi:hypothetical protein
MATLYWLSLIVGGGLALLSLFGDLLHLELPDFEVDTDAWHVLSLRSGMYLLLAFGATGLLLSASGVGALLAFIAAAFAGAAAAAISSAVFRYLRRSDSGDMPADASLVGLAGRVVLPIQRDGTGKVVVSRAGRDLELLARAFEAEPGVPVETWTDVVIVEVTAGTALVTPYSDATSSTGT